MTPSKLHAFTNPPRGHLSGPARAADAAPNTIRATATDETKAFFPLMKSPFCLADMLAWTCGVTAS